MAASDGNTLEEYEEDYVDELFKEIEAEMNQQLHHNSFDFVEMNPHLDHTAEKDFNDPLTLQRLPLYKILSYEDGIFTEASETVKKINPNTIENGPNDVLKKTTRNVKGNNTSKTHSGEERPSRKANKLNYLQMHRGNNQNQQHKTGTNQSQQHKNESKVKLVQINEKQDKTLLPKERSTSKPVAKDHKSIKKTPDDIGKKPTRNVKVSNICVTPSKDSEVESLSYENIEITALRIDPKVMYEKENPTSLPKETPNFSLKETKNNGKSVAKKGSDNAKVIKSNKTGEESEESEEDLGEQLITNDIQQKDLIVILKNWLASKTFFELHHVYFKPRRLTSADGNCWYRSVVDQLQLHQVADQPTTHTKLREQVCKILLKTEDLPEHFQPFIQNTIDFLYGGNRQKFKGLVYRQKKLRQFVDDNGIMVQATALFLRRNINIYSNSKKDGPGLTEQGGGEGSEILAPLTVFFYHKHYQSICKTE